MTPPRFDQDELAAHVALRRRKRGRMSRRRGRRSFWASVVLACVLIVGGMVTAATVTACSCIYSQVHGLDIHKLRPDYPGQNTVIYDRYGGKLATVASVQNRTHAQLERYLALAEGGDGGD